MWGGSSAILKMLQKGVFFDVGISHTGCWDFPHNTDWIEVCRVAKLANWLKYKELAMSVQFGTAVAMMAGESIPLTQDRC